MPKVKDGIKPSIEAREPKGALPKQHPLMHPLHGKDADHRKMGMKDKYLGDGPHIDMPDHQHPLHHPHTDINESHNDKQTQPGKY
jgi:hypothetical protein